MLKKIPGKHFYFIGNAVVSKQQGILNIIPQCIVLEFPSIFGQFYSDQAGMGIPLQNCIVGLL